MVQMWLSKPCVVVWNLWRERNSRIFEGKHRSFMEVIDSMIREMGGWLFVTKDFHGSCMANFIRDWKTCISIDCSGGESLSSRWCPPPIGIFKLNFDGSFFGNSGPSGFGCVIWDVEGEVIRIIMGPVGMVDSTKAEVLGLLMGLWQIRDLNFSGSLIEGDSKVVIGWEKGGLLGYWKYSHLIHEIIELVGLLNVKLSHIPRTQNEMVDCLAKWGSSPETVVRSNVIPDFLV